MSGKQQRLAAALQNFTAELDALSPPVDYQVAVTTTTVSERLGACGPAGIPTPPPGAAASGGERLLLRCRVGLFPILPRRGTFHQDPRRRWPSCAGGDYTAAQFAQ